MSTIWKLAVSGGKWCTICANCLNLFQCNINLNKWLGNLTTWKSWIACPEFLLVSNIMVIFPRHKLVPNWPEEARVTGSLRVKIMGYLLAWPGSSHDWVIRLFVRNVRLEIRDNVFIASFKYFVVEIERDCWPSIFNYFLSLLEGNVWMSTHKDSVM